MTVMSVLMMIMGCGIIFVWTADILSGRKFEYSSGILKSRDRESGELLLPHWIAEYGTAVGLIGGGIGLLISAGWAKSISLIFLGSLAYTSVNSLSWALSKRERFVYAIPMIMGIVVAIFSILFLLAREI